MKSLFENTTLTCGLNLLKISFGSRNEDNKIFEDVEELLELLLRWSGFITNTKRAVTECPVKQIPSGDIEELVRQQLQKMLSDITLIMRIAEKSGMNPVDVADCFREEFWNEISPGEYNRLVILLVEKAIVWQDRLELELKTSRVKSLMEELKNE